MFDPRLESQRITNRKSYYIKRMSYVVSELLEGETLHRRIRGNPLARSARLNMKRAFEYALQIAHGLAAELLLSKRLDT